MKRDNTRWLAVLIFAAIAYAYHQLPLNDFINYDDTIYVTENLHIRGGLSYEGIAWAFTTTYFSNWHPLTWLSYMFDIQLFGLNPAGHHFVSLLFHLANSLLLFTFLRKTTGAPWRSCSVALLFALHPLHVESVAWVSQRKDLLSAFFFLLTLHAYSEYAKNRGLSRYMLVAGAFVCGLLSKPMAITIPFVLLLLDYWPLGRLQGAAPAVASYVDSRRPPLTYLVLEKLPLVLLSLTSASVTYYAQKSGGAVNTLDRLSLWQNAGNAFIAYWGYVAKTVWPAGLAVFYPFDPSVITPGPVIGAALFMLLVSCMALFLGRRWPYVAVGWLWYVGTLVPVIGLVRIGSHSMADRYTYIPLIGLFVMGAWGIPDLLKNRRYGRQLVVLSTGGILMLLLLLTRLQLRYWRNSEELFGHALKVTRENWMAHHNLATSLLKKGEAVPALEHLLETVRINPGYATAYNNIGIAHEELGNGAEGIKAYRIALRIAPTYVEAHYNLALAYYGQGNMGLALAEYQILKRISSERAREFVLVTRRMGRNISETKGM